MSVEQGLLADILACPEDDGPRLVFADWCEDQGDLARARFIRAQIELARLDPSDPGYPALDQECKALLAENHGAWSEGVARLARKWTFRRGFVETIRLTGDQLVGRATQIWEEVPVREVTLERSARLHRVAQVPEMAWVEVLVATGLDVSDSEVRALAESPHLGRLHTLDLRANRVSGDGLRALATSTHLPKLTTLLLDGNPLSPSLGRALLGSSLLTRLRRFDLRDQGSTGEQFRAAAAAPAQAQSSGGSFAMQNNRFGEAALHQLLVSGSLVSLSGLQLRNCRLSGTAVRMLRDSEQGAALDRLDLTDNPIGDHGAAHLAASGCLGQLQTLLLTSCSIGREGVEALAASEHLGRVRELDLAGNDLTPPGVRSLAQSAMRPEVLRLPSVGYEEVAAELVLSPFFSQVRECQPPWLLRLRDRLATREPGGALDLEGLAREETLATLGGMVLAHRAACIRRLRVARGGLDAAGVRVLVRGNWESLAELDLRNNPLGDEGARGLAGAGFLRRLALLGLVECGIGPGGLSALADQLEDAALTRLWLTNNPIAAQGVEALRRCSLPKLSRLGLSGCGLGDAGLLALAQAPFLNHLEQFHAGRNEVTLEGLRGLLAGGRLRAARQLMLVENRLGNEGLTELSRGHDLDNLGTLHLGQNGIDDLSCMPSASALPVLTDLVLAANRIRGEALEPFVRGSLLQQLRCLDLSANPLGPEGAALLAGVPYRCRLSWLRLSSCGMQDAGLVALANSALLDTVEELDLTGNLLSDRSAQALVKSAHLGSLRVLKLGANRLGEGELDSLRERFGARLQV